MKRGEFEASNQSSPRHVYEVRLRKNHRGVDLISDALPLGRLWYGAPNEASNAIDYAKFRSRSHDAPAVTVIGKAFWDIGHAPAARPFSESFLKFLRTSLL
jgi:hypothetical protein